MRINDDEVSFVKSGKQTDVEEFGVADLHLLIGISRDQIYRDKIRVITQEYMCNALDAHIEADIPDKPIEVTVPTMLSPILKIKDYGIGIGDERLSIFTKYGDSTKRGDDDNIGGFGLGCKCAWSYTESFNVDTVFEQDGKKYNRVYSAYITHQRDPGNIRLIKEREVDFDTPTGTTISIPVMDNDIYMFKKLALFAALFWKTKPIFYEGDIEIEANNANIVEENNSWLVHKERLHRIDCATVIVGGVCYPIDFDILTDGKSDYEYDGDEVKEVEYKLTYEINTFFERNEDVSLIANVGEVDVKPSREELEYTIKTMKFLIDGLKSVYEEGVRRANEFVESNDVLEVINSFVNNSLKLKHMEVKWNDIGILTLMSAVHTHCWVVVEDDSFERYNVPVNDITDRTIVVCYATENGAKNGIERMQRVIELSPDFDNGIIMYADRYEESEVKKTMRDLFVTHDRIPTVRVKGEKKKITGIYLQYYENKCVAANLDEIDFDKAVFFHRKWNRLASELIPDFRKPSNKRITFKQVLKLFKDNGYTCYSVTDYATRRLIKDGYDLVFFEDIIEEEVARAFESCDVRYETAFHTPYEVDRIKPYIDELKNYADRVGRLNLKTALKLIEHLYHHKKNNDYQHILKLAQFFDLEMLVLPDRYYQIASRTIVRLVPFLRNLNNKRNQVSINIIRSYEEFEDES